MNINSGGGLSQTDQAEENQAQERARIEEEKSPHLENLQRKC